MEDRVNLLLVDDDEKLLSLLAEYLPRYEMDVRTASDPREGLELIRNSPPDLAVLDVSMPGLDGFELLREIRRFSPVPVIMLSARGDPTDKIVGLELGADDYMSKPFEPRELVTRIRTILRRTAGAVPDPPAESIRCFGSLVIDLTRREVLLKGEALSLTTMEFELLALLTEEAGRTWSREDIFNRIQGFDSGSHSRSVDILVSRVRKKLGEDARSARYIKSIHGFGYLFAGGTS
jgi:two-component system, OmpR family, response regulator